MSEGNGEAPELPNRWEWRTLGDLCEKPQYGYTTKASTTGTRKFLRTTDIAHGPIDWDEVPFCSEEPENPEKYRLRSGDLVISRSGSVGLSALIDDPPDAVFASYLIRFRPHEVLGDYLAWFLRSPSYWREIRARASGIGMNNVNAKKLSGIPVPVPPLDEQRWIVETVERNEVEIAAAEKGIARAAQLNSQLVRAVVEGELAELADAEYKIETPTSLASPIPHALAIGPFGSNLKVSDYTDDGVPLIFVRNIRQAEFDSPETKFVSAAKARELEAHRIRAGDLLVTKMGDPPGDCARYPASAPDAIITADCIRFAVAEDRADADYVAALFQTGLVKRQIHERTKGVAQRKISLRTFRTIELPTPSLKKQREILTNLNAARTRQEALEAQLKTLRIDADALRRSFLRAAFQGSLR